MLGNLYLARQKPEKRSDIFIKEPTTLSVEKSERNLWVYWTKRGMGMHYYLIRAEREQRGGTKSHGERSLYFCSLGILCCEHDLDAIDLYHPPGVLTRRSIVPFFSGHDVRLTVGGLGVIEDYRPALILTAEYDPLRDDGIAYATRLREAGVQATHWDQPALTHGFWNMGAILDEIHVIRKKTVAFLRAAFDRCSSATPGALTRTRFQSFFERIGATGLRPICFSRNAARSSKH